MKKLFSLLLVFALVVCVFSGCSANEEVIPTESKLVYGGYGLLAQTNLKEMYDDSKTIVIGKIVSFHSFDVTYNREEAELPPGETVHTEFTVEVEKVYKGEKIGKKVTFWEDGGEGTRIIVKNSACEAYYIGYEGLFFIYPSGWGGSPYLEIKDETLILPSYITPPVDYNSKDGRKYKFTTEEIDALMEEYKNMSKPKESSAK